MMDSEPRAAQSYADEIIPDYGLGGTSGILCAVTECDVDGPVDGSSPLRKAALGESAFRARATIECGLDEL